MTDTTHPLLLLLRGYENKFPHKLVEKFPRIANRMVELWNNASGMEEYFNGLMISDRPDRQGFPPEVAAEIFSLSSTYDTIRAEKIKESTDIWDVERAKEELERLDVRLTVANFARAAEAGDVSQCMLFISAAFDVNVRDARHWTPLMIAAFNGREELAKKLIEHGANIQASDNAGYTPMHWAAFNGYVELIKLLISMGGAVNASSNAGITPLLQSAARGHVKASAELLKGRADPNLAAEDGSTPLFKAVSNGHLELINMLLAAGASCHVTMKNGATLIGSAKLSRDPKVRERIAEAIHPFP